jgi:uncharacterized protein (TIGR02421 family)
MTFSLTDSDKERIRTAAHLLYQASCPIKILQTISWSDDVKAEFFAHNAEQLPTVEYVKFDPTPVLESLHEARQHILGGSFIEDWLEQQSRSLETGARMLAGVGTPVFFEHSRAAYGEPTSPMRFDTETPFQLAEKIRDTIQQINQVKLNIAPTTYQSATEVAEALDKACRHHFGNASPAISVVDTLSANALAGAKRIRIRRDARFTDRDAAQLLQHEAYIHVATALNGRAQTDLPILAAGHPGTTRTQEGLAVFAEIISGTIELDRLQRLADRVFAIQMAIDGADFIEVYRYFLARTDKPEQSFESARRVFRGGVITGGAPFTKDVVYLYGLLQVSNFIRAIFNAGRADCLLLLFCGKLDLTSLPALCELTAAGLCQFPQFLPPWIQDPRYLLALMTYSTFMNEIESERVGDYVKRLLADAPLVTVPESVESV